MIDSSVTLGDLRTELSASLKEYRCRVKTFYGFDKLFEDIRKEIFELTGIEEGSDIDVYAGFYGIGFIYNTMRFPIFTVVRRTSRVRSAVTPSYSALTLISNIPHHLCITRYKYCDESGYVADISDQTTMEMVLDLFKKTVSRYEDIIAEMVEICRSTGMTKDQVKKFRSLVTDNPDIADELIAKYDDLVRKDECT